ncbi:S-layer homology domain-containing protein [Paenibacillus sp. BAC0078]
MKKGKIILMLVVSLLLLFNSLGGVVPAANADSSTTSLELSLPTNLTDWVLDEDAGYIYAISSMDSNLYFIRLSDLKIEKTLNVGYNPSYLARDGQSLQIALSGASMIKTVNLSTQQISDTIITNGVPDSVAAASNHLFYGTSDGVYTYDKVTQTSSLLFRNFLYDGALAIDEPSNILYAGGLSSSAGIAAIDAETGAILSQDPYDNMEIGGASVSLKHILIDEKSVYFGGHQFNKQNLTETTGTYSRSSNDYSYLESVILDISDDYVLTTAGVYDKNTYMQLVEFPTKKRFALLDSKGHAYVAGIENWFDDAKKITRIDLSVPQRTTSVFTTDSYSVRSDKTITDWATTDNSHYIYAIVADTNELVVIHKDDMSVVKKMFIGSSPSRIKIFNNKAYIIFKGENRINILDLQDGIPSEAGSTRITTKNYPLDVFPDNNNRILYNGGLYGAGISVTSAVYTTVADAVYNEKESGISHSNSYVLDPDQEILYGGDSFSLYRYNSQNFNLIEKNDIEIGYYDPKIVLDNNNLYYGSRRYEANQISNLYGTYPQNIIYSRGNLVFGNGAVYDRESFTKSYDLLMYTQHAYVDPDNSIFISSDNRLYKFHSFEEMQSIMNEARQPSNAVFVDEDMTSGTIDGYLSFEPPADQEGIKGYAAYFLDQNGNKLKRAGIFQRLDLSTGSLFVYEISQSLLPEGTVSIGVYPVVRNDIYSSERPLDVHTTAPIYDAPNYLPVDLSVTDMNPDVSTFSGTVTWKAGIAELPGTRYTLYFIDEKGSFGDAIAVMNGGQKSYTLTISDKVVPKEALGLGIFMENDDFKSPLYSRAVFEDKVTPDIPASSIIIHKYQLDADNVVVNDLVAGDIIRVYNERLTRLMGYGIVEPNKATITITINNIGNPGDKLRITRQTANRIESMGTLVVVPSVTDGSNGGTGGGAGTGGGGGTGSGGGTSGGGGTVGAVSTDNANIVTTIKENTDGTHSSLTDVGTEFISKTINNPEFKKNPVIIIKADEKTATQSSLFQIDLNSITSINNNSKDAVLILESTSGKLQLPVNSLFLAVSGYSGSEQKIIITIAQAANDYTAKLTTQLSSSTSVPLGGPVEYEVKLTGSGQDHILTNFTDYVGHVLNFNVTQDANTVYTGLTYDPVTKTYVPVPTTWEWKDGILQVTMKRKGNSVYTVVQSHVQFNDLNNSNPYRESILALANRSVINGYADGSFKAESVVTRAEFAAMLNRALGILPKLQASKNFKDVKIGAWYAQQVNAAVDVGLINGFSDGTFRPDQEITHQEMVVMLVNALKYAETDTAVNKTSSTVFPDKLPDWAKPYYVIALENEILPSNSPFLFQTGKKTQRQESALLLYQLMKVLKLTNV